MGTDAGAVIVGAGPAGAALALLLARRGAAVTLLERQSDFAREFRGEGLMPSGVDALAQMGLREELAGLPQSRVERLRVYQDAREILALELGPDGGPLFVSQPALLEMLVAEAARFPGFRLERGFTARDVIREDGRAVAVRGDTPEGPREVPADFVVATDGRASALRRRSGLDERGSRSAPSFDVVWCKLPLPEFVRAERAGRAYLGRGHLCLAFRAPDDRLQLAWVIEKGGFGELRRRGVDEWLAELEDHVSADLASHVSDHRGEVGDPFLLDVVCHHLPRWGAPGLLLLGDAAHPMSPVGAQGINLALRDALVAANHLGPLLERPGASPADLDAAARRVWEERLPEVRSIQRLQALAPRVAFQRSAASRALVRLGAPLVLGTRPGRALFARLARRFTRGARPVRLEEAKEARAARARESAQAR